MRVSAAVGQGLSLLVCAASLLAFVSVVEEGFSMAAFLFFAECSPSLPFLACAASLPALVSAVMQHWGETEAESAVAGLHLPEVEGCFAVAAMCFSCVARHCCSSGVCFSADFSGVSVAEELFSVVALSFCSK